MSTSIKTLERDLELSSLRYLQIRCEYRSKVILGEDLSEIETVRTQAHNALIANFEAVLRNQSIKDKMMLDAHRGGRVAIGMWGLNEAIKKILT